MQENTNILTYIPNSLRSQQPSVYVNTRQARHFDTFLCVFDCLSPHSKPIVVLFVFRSILEHTHRKSPFLFQLNAKACPAVDDNL